MRIHPSVLSVCLLLAGLFAASCKDKTTPEEETPEGSTLKVLGKIDLDSLNAKTRPEKKKSTKQTEAKKAETKTPEPKKAEEKSEYEQEDTCLKTSFA